AALCNLHAQTFAGAFCLRPKQSSQLSNSAVSDINHNSIKYGCEFTKSKEPQMHRTPFFFAIRTLKSKIKANEPDSIAARDRCQPGCGWRSGGTSCFRGERAN